MIPDIKIVEIVAIHGNARPCVSTATRAQRKKRAILSQLDDKTAAKTHFITPFWQQLRLG